MSVWECGVCRSCVCGSVECVGDECVGVWSVYELCV